MIIIKYVIEDKVIDVAFYGKEHKSVFLFEPHSLTRARPSIFTSTPSKIFFQNQFNAVIKACI